MHRAAGGRTDSQQGDAGTVRSDTGCVHQVTQKDEVLRGSLHKAICAKSLNEQTDPWSQKQGSGHLGTGKGDPGGHECLHCLCGGARAGFRGLHLVTEPRTTSVQLSEGHCHPNRTGREAQCDGLAIRWTLNVAQRPTRYSLVSRVAPRGGGGKSGGGAWWEVPRPPWIVPVEAAPRDSGPTSLSRAWPAPPPWLLH